MHVSATPSGLSDSLLGGSGDDRYVFYTQNAGSSSFITEHVGQGNDTLDFTLISAIFPADMHQLADGMPDVVFDHLKKLS